MNLVVSKKKLRKYLFNSPHGMLFFYKIRVLREKLALARYSDYEYVKNTYKKRFNKEIDLKDPKCYTEKLQWLKLFYRDMNMTICADKYAVREYIENKGLKNLLNTLIGVYENVEDINFENLPNKFVAKATHGSSWNLICKNKDDLNWKVWKKILKSWLNLNHYVFGREWNYKNIRPRIIIEKFIEYEPLIDYKFMCFNGEPKYIQINNDYQGMHYVDFYDINLKKVDFTYKNYQMSNRTIEKPAGFEEMIRLAKFLSKDFPYVRVDFYNQGKEIIFGEMTFFPGGGLLPLVPVNNQYDRLLGDLIVLPSPNYNLEILESL
jgi:hypothetical protein